MESVSPGQGWGVLHLFCVLTPDLDRDAVIGAVAEARTNDHQVVCFAVLGHKADVGFMALGPDLWHLRRFQAALGAAGLEVVDSYVSFTELSEYAQDLPPEMAEARLHPRLPPDGKRAICFYPMSKRREAHANWYTMPFEERKELMYGHGKKGREFAGRILQLITGSTGVDDWEWGVTLFAADPTDLKQVVYEMRFDEASSIYAEFGPFVTGLVAEAGELLEEVGR
ncbi:MAG TPA: chlorite dismutase family protein [Acidimicrobiales bacterium]